MSSLYKRTWSLRVGDVDVSDLDISFDVKRDTTREPNTATIRVFNLADRSRIVNDSDVVLSVGYVDTGANVGFIGKAWRVHHAVEDLDIVTVIEAKDTGRSYLEGELYRDYRDARNVDIVSDCVEALGIERGNIDVLNGATISAFTASGPARDVLRDILRATHHRFSIQDGALQIQRGAVPVQSTFVPRIAGDSGMVGSPTMTFGKHKRDDRINVVCAIQPGCEPGKRIKIESDLIDTYAEIKGVQISGDTMSDDWTMRLECKAI